METTAELTINTRLLLLLLTTADLIGILWTHCTCH